MLHLTSERRPQGPLQLGDLGSGEFRFLTDREANALRELVEERVELAKSGQVPNARRQRPKRREGWAKPAGPKKKSSKKK